MTDAQKQMFRDWLEAQIQEEELTAINALAPAAIRAAKARADAFCDALMHFDDICD